MSPKITPSFINNIWKVFFGLHVFMYSAYFYIVPKEKISKLYLGMIFFISVGELLLTDSYQYFEYVMYSYLLAHLLFTIVIYRYYLANESKFDVFTFSLPFLLTFCIIYIVKCRFFMGNSCSIYRYSCLCKCINSIT